MDLCGHRGFAGPSACILEEGHFGKHQYGDWATAYDVELRKDAERYRFLREAAHCAAKMEALNKANREPQTPAEFDAAVDAAMKTPNVQSHRDAQGSSRGSGGLAGSTTRGRE